MKRCLLIGLVLCAVVLPACAGTAGQVDIAGVGESAAGAVSVCWDRLAEIPAHCGHAGEQLSSWFVSLNFFGIFH